jgi:hypothetical protein
MRGQSERPTGIINVIEHGYLVFVVGCRWNSTQVVVEMDY